MSSPSPPTPAAVFLSYAREDADAARRIADALRAFGVDVWFDQAELRGGDAWDAKIKKQIRECTLFVPLISRTTEGRPEGYFRREWKMAAERTHDMAASRAFLVPVTIDGTPEAGAEVPAEFMRVQWTHLGGGLPTPDFVDRVKHLLAQTASSAGQVVDLPLPRSRGSPTSSPARPRQPWSRYAALALVSVIIIGAGFFLLRKSAPVPSLAKAENKSPAAAVVVDEKSIAVLPFKNQSPDAENAFFTDGVHEDILTSLFNIRDLHVVSRTSVEQYRDSRKTIRQIGEELKVAYVLEGSVQRARNKVHVTGQLIDARTDRHAWAKSYDRELTDIFAIQAELAKGIANELQAVISPEAAKLLERKPTDNLDAWDKFLRARTLKNTVLNETARAPMQKLLEEAVVLDPKFARAWAWLGNLHGEAYLFYRDQTPGRLAKAKAAIETAVRLAPDDPEVILNYGLHHWHARRDYGRAIEQIQRVAKMQPESAVWRWALASVQRRQGNWTESLANYRRATQLEPSNADYSNLLLHNLIAGRRYEEAREERNRLASFLSPRGFGSETQRLEFLFRGPTQEVIAYLEKPSSGSALARGTWAAGLGPPLSNEELAALNPVRAAVALAAAGNLTAARAKLADVAVKLREQVRQQPDTSLYWGNLARVEAILGNRADALRCALKGVELLPETVDALDGVARRSDLAFVYAWTGDKDRAIAEYAHLLRVPNYTGNSGPLSNLDNAHVMKQHPAYAPLRGDPRFEALLSDPQNNAPLF